MAFTARVTPACLRCGQPLPPGRARRWCSSPCPQAAYRRRHHATPDLHLTPPRSRPHATVYECLSCEQRYLDELRCAECNRFCRRLGPGAACLTATNPWPWRTYSSDPLASLLPASSTTSSNQVRSWPLPGGSFFQAETWITFHAETTPGVQRRSAMRRGGPAGPAAVAIPPG